MELTNRTIYGMEGNLSSPGYPDQYPNNVKIVTNLQGPYGTRVIVILDFVSIEDQEECLYDFVQLETIMSDVEANSASDNIYYDGGKKAAKFYISKKYNNSDKVKETDTEDVIPQENISSDEYEQNLTDEPELIFGKSNNSLRRTVTEYIDGSFLDREYFSKNLPETSASPNLEIRPELPQAKGKVEEVGEKTSAKRYCGELASHGYG